MYTLFLFDTRQIHCKSVIQFQRLDTTFED